MIDAMLIIEGTLVTVKTGFVRFCEIAIHSSGFVSDLFR